MPSRAFQMFSLYICLMAMAAPALPQEGHPLVGSWHGERGSSPANTTQVTLIMDWDGTALTGLVNPGFEHAALQGAKLNPKNWTLHFELDFKDKSGKIEHCVVDGKLDRLGFDRRTLTGTWNCGTTKTDFKLTRDQDYFR